MTGRRFLSENVKNAIGAGIATSAIVLYFEVVRAQYINGQHEYLRQLPQMTGESVIAGVGISLAYYLIHRRKKQ